MDTRQPHLKVTTTEADYTHFRQWVVKEHEPNESKIKLVQHTPRIKKVGNKTLPSGHK